MQPMADQQIHNRRSGFTLLEILITTVILSAGIVAIAWAFSTGMFAATDIENTDLAINIAQAKMEDVKNTPFGSLADSGPTPDPNFTNFNVAVNVAENTNPMQVDVTVTWQVKNQDVSITLTTLVANY